MALIAVSGWGATAEDLQIFPLFAAAGAGLGLLMGIPAYWTMRLCVPWITSRAVSVLVFFALGAASVVVSLVIVALVTGSGISEHFTDSDAGGLVGLSLFAAIAGIFTAAAAPLVLRPAPGSLRP